MNLQDLQEGIDLAVTEQRKLEQVLNLANSYFTEQGKHSKAQTYLQSRGLSSKTIQEWGLGYAPNSGLIDFMHGQGISDLSILQVMGLVRQNERGAYDFFRERVTLPLTSGSGKVTAFAGRALDQNAEVKYLSSPENPLFRKRELLFGLDKVQRNLYSKGAVITEGYFDVISAWQTGIRNVLAVAGNALLLEQILQLRRYTAQATLALDGDAAGIDGAKKAAKLLAPFFYFTIPKMILIPGGEDLDDFLRRSEDPKKAWEELPRYDFVNFYARTSLPQDREADVYDKVRALEDIFAYLKEDKNVVRQALWLPKIVKAIGISHQIVIDAYYRQFDPFEAFFAEESIYGENLSAAYLANLLCTAPEILSSYFKEVPSSGRIFSPELKAVYEALRENCADLKRRALLPMRRPLRGQLDFIENSRSEELNAYFEEKTGRPIPDSLREQLSGSLYCPDLDLCSRILQEQLLSRKRRDHFNLLQQAVQRDNLPVMEMAASQLGVTLNE